MNLLAVTLANMAKLRKRLVRVVDSVVTLSARGYVNACSRRGRFIMWLACKPEHLFGKLNYKRRPAYINGKPVKCLSKLGSFSCKWFDFWRARVVIPNPTGDGDWYQACPHHNDNECHYA